ncbi:MAG: sugar phosphate nucleotidyltransferase [Brevinematales bacterium]|nr:sugar phosphate nucleotidyltransferase [Brevinematales bacterium]
MGLKVIIPVAGKGTRLRPHTLLIPKTLINVADRKIIDYIMYMTSNVEVEEYIFVIGYLGEQIEEYVKKAYPKIRKTFVIQENPKGLAHAISITKDFISPKDKLLIILGDLIFFTDVKKVLQQTPQGEHSIGVVNVEDPHKYGVVVLGRDGKYIKEMVEKPSKPISNLAISGIYYFTEAEPLLNAIDYIIENDIRTKNEYQLTDAMMDMIKRGHKISIFETSEVYDCGSKEKLIEANNKLLTKFHNESTIGINVKNSIVIPPVYISPNALVEDSVIGPFVSIHEGATVKNSIIRESIVEERAKVEGMIIERSLIGQDSIVEESFRELNIGPHSEYKKKGF